MKNSKATKSVATISKGSSVNVTLKDEVFVATVVSIKGDAVDVKFSDDSVETVKTSAVELRKRGRKSLEEECTPAEINSQVSKLLQELAAASDIDEKKRIRRALRRRGHQGGLGIRKAAKKAKASKKAAKK